jgi:phosphoribosylaminoimidazole-succinocarboxamide synthase
VLETQIPGIPLRRGKVRDVYDLGDRLLIVATDRISAFDWVLPNGIPDKGRILTELSLFWFNLLGEPHHLLSADTLDFPLPSGVDLGMLAGRSMLVRKTRVAPIECVVRGYLAGSGWKEYRRDGAVCGLKLPPGLVESSRLPAPIFTPATKAETGHDENISYEQMADVLGAPQADELRRRSLAVYERGAAYARGRGIVIADTKFEWGEVDGEYILIDEVLTPDSSRFWPADAYRPGGPQSSFDKQFVRDWLETTGWDKSSPPPAMPQEVALATRRKYVDALAALTGKSFDS